MTAPNDDTTNPTALRGWLLITMLVIVAGGLGVRIWAAAHNVFPSVDGVFYMDQTAKLVKHGYVPYSVFPPGWPALAAIPYLFFDHNDPLAILRATQTANVILGTLLPWLAFVMMRPLLGTRLSVLGAAILMFQPMAIVFSKNDLSDMSFACVLLASWLLLRKRRLSWAGWMLAFSYLVRPEGILAAAGLTLWLWWRDRRLPWALIIPLSLGIIPYLVFIWSNTGTLQLTSKGAAFELSRAAYPGWQMAKLVWLNLTVILPKLGGLLGLPLVLLALWGMFCRRGAWLWLLTPLLPMPFIVYAMVARYWMPYIPIFLLAAGLGALHLTSQPWLQARWRRVVFTVVVLAGLGQAVRDDIYWVRHNDEAYYGLKDAGAWLADKTERGTIVAAYKPYTSFWANCRFIKYPKDLDANSLVAWSRNSGARYMIVNVKVAHHLAKGLDPLLASPLPSHLAQKVTLVKLLQYDLVEHNTAIYQINNPLP